MPPQSGRGRRAKGMQGQREAAAAWSAATGIPARNGAQGGLVGGMDVEHAAAIRLEVKRTERLQLAPAMAQAAADAGGQPWAVLHRSNRKPWTLILPLDELLPFVDALLAARAAVPKIEDSPR